MKLTFWHLVLVCAVCAFIGCAAGRQAFTNPPDTTNAAGQITPGISPATDALMAAQAVNKAANPTPTREPLDVILGALIVAASAGGGWLARHATQRKQPPPPQV